MTYKNSISLMFVACCLLSALSTSYASSANAKETKATFKSPSKAKSDSSKDTATIISMSEGGSDVGGGDEHGLDFRHRLSNAKFNSLKSKNEKLRFAGGILQSLENVVKVVVAPVPPVTLGGVTQMSTAVNRRSDRLVQIDPTRWPVVRSNCLKEGIALHEVLSLHRDKATGDYLESTGHYPYSELYLAQCGSTLKELEVALGRATNTCSVSISGSVAGFNDQDIVRLVSDRARALGAQVVEDSSAAELAIYLGVFVLKEGSEIDSYCSFTNCSRKFNATYQLQLNTYSLELGARELVDSQKRPAQSGVIDESDKRGLTFPNGSKYSASDIKQLVSQMKLNCK